MPDLGFALNAVAVNNVRLGMASLPRGSVGPYAFVRSQHIRLSSREMRVVSVPGVLVACNS